MVALRSACALYELIFICSRFICDGFRSVTKTSVEKMQDIL